MVVKEGESGVFCCELSKPEAPVEWRKGRVILKSGQKYEMKQEGRLTKLIISNVEESDAGKYTCKTKDSQSTAELTVRGKRHLITTPATCSMMDMSCSAKFFFFLKKCS